ncbi:MAG: methyltransferase domain-containing protein [archaeon]
MREEAQRNEKKYSSGIVEADCSLEKYDSFLKNAGANENLEGICLGIAERGGTARLLDIGCGNGKALWELKQKLWKKVWICGMDLVKPEFKLDEFIGGDALEKEFPCEADLIVSFRALHEIGFPEKILEKCCSALASGGRAILSFRAMEFREGKLAYLGEMKAEDIGFLEAVLEEKRFGECRAGGKTVYAFEEAEREGKKGTVAFIAGINVFLEKK